MLDVRKFRSRTPFHYLFLLLLALSIPLTAQDKDKDKDKGKEKEPKKADASGSGNFVKVGGKVRCDKPDPAYSIEVPDRPGHALMLAKSKDGVAIEFPEKMEGTLHTHGFEVDTFDNGEKVTMQSMGHVLADQGPADSKGRWSLMRGTGKFKGIKGGGTYEGKLEADDVLTVEFEGVYDPSEMVAEKK